MKFKNENENAWVLILIEKTQMILNIFLTYDYTAITLNSLPCIQILRDLILQNNVG